MMISAGSRWREIGADFLSCSRRAYRLALCGGVDESAGGFKPVWRGRAGRVEMKNCKGC